MKLSRCRCVVALAAVVFESSAHAQVVRQITDVKTVVAGPGALDDAGTAIYAGASADLAGTNPSHAFQIVKWDPATGVATQITSAAGGVSPVVSVSDDGVWLAFPSAADLVGTNHDRSIELYVMRSDGTQVAQLTNDTAPNAGSVTSVVVSGNGQHIAFLANTDPLGTNPTHHAQLFVINRDGTGLKQLTAVTTGSFGGPAINDDGTRLVFAFAGDPTGGNADLGSEVFAILADGTGLRQLSASPATYGASAPSLSGNGAKVAFQSDADPLGTNPSHWTEVFVVDWAGTGLKQLTKTTTALGITGDPVSAAPSLTDDGLTVVYYSNMSRLFPPLNFDGNYEIFRIKTDGTGMTALTNTILTGGCLLPTVSGSGNRIAYYGVDTGLKIATIDGNGGSARDLLAFSLALDGSAEVGADGTRAAFVRSTGLFSPAQVWRVDTDGSDLAQVTALSSGNAATPVIASDGTFVFSANSNPAGASNADLSDEIFAIAPDGSGLRQLTSGPAGTSSLRPAVASAAPVVVFDSSADLTGGNADGSREVFKVGLDGTGLVRLTSGAAATESRRPRVDASGTWVAFESNADLDGGNADGSFEIWRVRIDGSGLQRITGDPVKSSSSADIDPAGLHVAFASTADPLGANPEGNTEIFVWDAPAGPVRQLTSFAVGDSRAPRFGPDGTAVSFASDAAVTEDDPDTPTDLYRVPAVGGAIERIGAARAGLVGGLDLVGGSGGAAISPDRFGIASVFSGLGNFTGGNDDLLPQVWTIDTRVAPSIEVGRPSPTELSWGYEPGPIRYDAVRGDVASLHLAGSTVDLGPVVCLENDSPDADTKGFGDVVDPVPGQVFFFVYRGSAGLLAGPGSYGQGTGGRERVAGAGGCAP